MVIIRRRNYVDVKSERIQRKLSVVALIKHGSRNYVVTFIKRSDYTACAARD